MERFKLLAPVDSIIVDQKLDVNYVVTKLIVELTSIACKSWKNCVHLPENPKYQITYSVVFAETITVSPQSKANPSLWENKFQVCFYFNK